MAGRKNRVKLTDQKANKPWLRKKDKIAIVIRAKRTFLILCEGQTEKDYFSAFNSDRVAVSTKHLGCAGEELVVCAIEYADGESYDEVWAVYDVDYNANEGEKQFERFANSLRLAAENNIKVAYSNDAFELWFRLHYEQVTGTLTRRQLYEDLSKRWNMDYAGDGKQRKFTSTINKRISEDEYADVRLAIQRAEKLYEQNAHLPFAEQNPLTTVHLLVARLLDPPEENL